MNNNLADATRKHNAAYAKWRAFGCPEAFTELNDSNRELIKAYMAEHSKAKGYKLYHGEIDLHENSLYNFCCDFVFDSEMIKPDTKCAPFRVSEQFSSRNSIILIWS